jgi:PAS domain S-box-containing protein
VVRGFKPEGHMSTAKSEYTEPTAWEVELQRVNGALRLVSACNKALTVATDVVAWLKQVCQSAVEVGGYRMAWVGFAESDEKKTVRPVAHAGFEAGYLETVKVTWNDEPGGRGPAGTAIRTGKYCIARDIPNDPAFDPWREAISQQGYKSSIALPLSSDGNPFGVLTLYSEEVDAFTEKEIEVLQELAHDLAYGLIVVFRLGIERRSATDSLQESQRRLRHAEEISHLVQWDRDLETNIIKWSDDLYRMLGREPEKRTLQLREFLAMVHPDDRARVGKMADELVNGPGKFQVDYRIIRPDGQLRYIHGEGEIVRDDTGRPRRSVGFLQDVTEQQLAKIALEKANRSLETKNIALKEVLGNIEAEQGKIGLRVNKNVEEVILPLVQSLKQGATRRQQRAIDQIESSLREIISSFTDDLARAVKSLTPMELRVCTFIKRGLAVKEIAELEHLSPETISAHRRNIRRKLQIANRKINLASYLRTAFRAPITQSQQSGSGS